MSRRESQFFNISFLDVLSGALGAIIFLFIITPKGGSAPASKHQFNIYYDTIHHQVFGNLPDSLFSKRIGDTMLVLLSDFKELPTIKDCPPCPPSQPCPPCPENSNFVRNVHESKSSTNSMTESSSNASESKVNSTPTPAIEQPSKTTSKPEYKQSKYKGDLPSVPCKVSFEINWADKADNIDLIVCKDGKCVSGANRNDKSIGFWDSGKSKTNFFGSDLRTNQEAVRQFDKLISGTYQLYAKFKESEKNNSLITISGLIFTKSEDGKEKGESFTKNLSLDKSKKQLLGTVKISEDGQFYFQEN